MVAELHGGGSSGVVEREVAKKAGVAGAALVTRGILHLALFVKKAVSFFFFFFFAKF